MIYEDLTERIIKTCFEVINELGCGFLENVYQNAMLIALEQAGLGVKSQVPLKVEFRAAVVGEYFADLVVENKIIIELKTVKALAPEHFAQVLNYLKATGMKVGLLVNFGKPKIEFHRLNNYIARIDSTVRQIL